MKSIVAALDFSTVSEEVVRHAAQLAGAFSSQVHLIHVNSGSKSPYSQNIGNSDQVALDLQSDNSQLAKMKSICEDAGVECTVHLLSGSVIDMLCKVAQDQEAQYIVMGNQGQGAVHHLVMGSVAEGVMKKTQIPVLLVPRT